MAPTMQELIELQETVQKIREEERRLARANNPIRLLGLGSTYGRKGSSMK